MPNGMGLCCVYAHGITDMHEMEKLLIGMLACASERHTAVSLTPFHSHNYESKFADVDMTGHCSRGLVSMFVDLKVPAFRESFGVTVTDGRLLKSY